MFQRRTVVYILAGLLGLVLAGAGLTAFLLSRRSPPTPTTAPGVVDAYLHALQDGDVDRAVAYWHDSGGITDGQAPLRQRVRTYLDQHRDDYRRALRGRTWALREFPAAGTGIGVDVTIGAAKETYVVTHKSKDFGTLLIFAGPEDYLGPVDEDNTLLRGA
ncbi:hypothetical protein [Dactylosporangium sp. NPDC051541]|uniref:hypothetical protein n=1 Tax=Dactylosporangium sp. NPDC051541 TaxID=3363977 RepID=UPI003789E31C